MVFSICTNSKPVNSAGIFCFTVMIRWSGQVEPGRVVIWEFYILLNAGTTDAWTTLTQWVKLLTASGLVPRNEQKISESSCSEGTNLQNILTSGGWFNIKTTFYQYRKYHCGDKTILQPSYLHNGISYTGKMTLGWSTKKLKSFILRSMVSH